MIMTTPGFSAQDVLATWRFPLVITARSAAAKAWNLREDITSTLQAVRYVRERWSCSASRYSLRNCTHCGLRLDEKGL
jgi:hypothetical protein